MLYKEDPNNPEHVEAAERAVTFKHGWYFFPIFFGDYPPVMRELVDLKSEQEGRLESRLPSFDANWSALLKGIIKKNYVAYNAHKT